MSCDIYLNYECTSIMIFNRLPAFKQILDNVIKRSRDSVWLINLGWENFREEIMH